ncbi:TadE/TadG family type IV pilus assembly protein [Pelagibacterium limicola]|uniref:TadE/TadG family type IV pilus assembly protein n=1 Tax=Pelagibacterium limicola TaxID=2791022 RepID=UPI0018AF83C0|nr:TadE/TadG family type IV pilus assembly protein [Pelagibacterium limicola]
MFRVRFRKLLALLQRSEKGVAAVEFALVVPVLLVLYLGSVDISQGIQADRKLASVAGTLGDLVAQTRTTLPVSTLNDYFSASQAIMLPFDGSQTSMLLTIVYVDADGTARVRTSRGANGATPQSQNATYPLPAEITNLARDNYVVVSEAWYTYHPVVGYVITTDIQLYKQFFYIPRFGQEIVIQ